MTLAALAGCNGVSADERTPVVNAAAKGGVLTGLDVLLGDSVHLVRGKRVGLVTNLAAVDRSGRSAVDRFREAPFTLVALFGPEHGLDAQAAPGEKVASSIDTVGKVPIYSLYGATRRPTSEMLAGIEVLVVDLPDVGARYYTYPATGVEVMLAAAQAGIPVLVADRPNPIGGVMQGNILDTAYTSMVGRLAVPMRHGLTLGEELLLARSDLGIEVQLTVIPAAGWRRDVHFEATGLPFRAPSPNLKDVDALFHYPGTCLFEGTALSVGRGTDFPFHQVGAPWLDTTRVLASMSRRALPGVRFEGVTFTPRNPGDAKFADVEVVGIRVVITDRELYDPTAAAVHLLTVLQAVHPQEVKIGGSFDRLAGGSDLREAILTGVPADQIVAAWQPELAAYRERAAEFLIYP